MQFTGVDGWRKGSKENIKQCLIRFNFSIGLNTSSSLKCHVSTIIPQTYNLLINSLSKFTVPWTTAFVNPSIITEAREWNFKMWMKFVEK